MIRQIKIPRGLASVVVADREVTQMGKYNVNRLIKAVDFFLCLKSESHKIHHYAKHLEYLQTLTKTSRATFYARLWAARDLGLLSIEDYKHIQLTSWSKASDILGYKHNEFYHTVNYDTTNKAHTLKYILATLEIQENMDKQLYKIGKKVTDNPEIEADFMEYCQSEGITADFTLQNFQAVKIQAFATGTKRTLYDDLHSFNPSFQRNIKTIAKAQGHKHWQGMAYAKAQLLERGLIEVERQTPARCKFKGTKQQPGEKRGATQYGRFYSPLHKTALWYQPDTISPANGLFCSPDACLQASKTPRKVA